MKTILITGASGGLGQASVQLFHSKGWKVIATMRTPGKVKDFDHLDNVTVLPLDITNPDQIRETAARAIAMGPIDVVLNNAAFGAVGPMEGVTDEQLVNQVNTNLLGAIRVTQAFIPHFREKRSGLFINITSIAGLVTFPFASTYHATKFGLEGWSEGISYELARFGIGVKTIAPGYIRTNFGAHMDVSVAEPYQPLMEKFMQTVTRLMDPTTMGSTPEQVAEVVYEAATDGKNQVRYVAGDDAKALYARRNEIGNEAFRGEMQKMVFGN